MPDSHFARALNNFVDTINNGPDALDPALFDGPLDRVLLGLKAHANSISYARLTALEDSFPLTRAHMGDTDFNAIAREYVETPPARASDANRIGAAFPAYLETTSADHSTQILAQIEWAWLTSYNAADAQAMQLADLGGLDETAMLALTLIRHPAALTVPLYAPMPALLMEQLSSAPHCSDAAALLITRPDRQVLLEPLDELTGLIFALCNKMTSISNLLSAILEQGGEDAPLEPILTLIGAGALVIAPLD
ncbi:DNA-binding domain-containing protein [Sphingorhabdus arenilitoris]|uniref:DNA-binding domain-containing protein n=1 Tax=Sphingorhabdus arenilitoris TaxID=1490041 RepID=A0ABV8RF24_9SPHN